MELLSNFIAFFGPDGSGKSTQAQLLFNHLQSHGKKVKIVWIRSPHTLAYLLSCFFIQIGFRRVVENPFGKKKDFPSVHTNRLFRIFWSMLELVSVIPLILFRVYIPLLLGYTVIAERYVADTIVTISYYTKNLKFVQSLTAKILLGFIPKNTYLIHIDSNYPTLLKRRGVYVEAFDFIQFQRKGYEIIDNLIDTTYIDTSNISVEQTFTKILSHLT